MHPDSIKSQNSNRKSNIIMIFGVEESPTKTPKSVCLQKDTNKVVEIFNNSDVCIESSHILDSFCLENSIKT